MSFALNGFDDVGTPMERRSVHGHDRLRRCHRQEGVPYPRTEDIGVDVAIPEINREQSEGADCSDGIQSPSRVPVLLAVAPGSCAGVSVRPRGIHGEAALIEVHDGTPLHIFVPPYPRLKLQTLNDVSFGMQQSFFYS